jgi:hypothetical protein
MNDHFFIAGAQRSATTYLYHLLAEHPEIEMAQPVRPEPKFFLVDELFEHGLAYYRERFFPGKPGARLRGEKSTSYMESEIAAQRIARCFPESHILFLLRDPIERAISNYWFSVNNGLESLPLEEAFRREEERWQQYDRSRVSVSPYAYLRRGRYIDFIEVYERYFSLLNCWCCWTNGWSGMPRRSGTFMLRWVCLLNSCHRGYIAWSTKATSFCLHSPPLSKRIWWPTTPMSTRAWRNASAWTSLAGGIFNERLPGAL